MPKSITALLAIILAPSLVACVHTDSGIRAEWTYFGKIEIPPDRIKVPLPEVNETDRGETPTYKADTPSIDPAGYFLIIKNVSKHFVTLNSIKIFTSNQPPQTHPEMTIKEPLFLAPFGSQRFELPVNVCIIPSLVSFKVTTEGKKERKYQEPGIAITGDMTSNMLRDFREDECQTEAKITLIEPRF